MLNPRLPVETPEGPVDWAGGTVRAILYLALVGAAVLLLLLPLRAVDGPARAEVPRAVMAREGRYAQSLRPGEARTYVLEVAGRGLLKVRFAGTGEDLGLRIEDAEGARIESAGPGGPRERRFGVANPSAATRTLYLTVYRATGTVPRRPVSSGGAAPGAYELELGRDLMP